MLLAPWLFCCLTLPEFVRAEAVLPAVTKPRSLWTIRENRVWLGNRGIDIP